MTIRKLLIVGAGWLLSCLYTGLCSAQTNDDISGSVLFQNPETNDSKFITLTFQNDVFVGEDNGYTNGVGFTYGRGPFLSFSKDNIPVWLNALSSRTYIQTKPDKIRGVAYMFFQRMQTPNDIEVVELQKDDIPYAGFVALQTTMFSWDRNVSDQLSFIFGAVGPIALAERAQKNVHSAIGADQPLGWDNQIEDEFVFKVGALRVQKFYKNYGERYGFDLLGLANLGLGTVESAIKAGVALRWGSNMEYSHATFSLQTDRQVNSLALSKRNDFYLYAGLGAGLVFNDILIDGNTFTDSHSAPLEHLQNTATAGAVWKRNSLAYVFQLSTFSSRTTLSSKREKYGAFSLTYAFK